MSEPVTWLMAIRNGMPFLPQTLESIERQTYRHWKIIAWDNGSTDDTLNELHRWIPSRLPGVIVSDRPLGLGASLAAMVEMADTELCARMDDDDICLPDRLEKQVAFMAAHPKVGVLGTQITLIDEASQEMPGSWTYPCDDASIRWRLRFSASLMHPSVMFRRSLVLKAGNYRDVMPQEDQDLWLRMSCVGEIANLPERLVRYRRRAVRSTRIPAKQGRDTVRELVTLYAPQLFPGLKLEEVLRLNELLSYEPTAPATRADVKLLERAAHHAANSQGFSADYYTGCGTYRQHRRDLLTRWLRTYPLIGRMLAKAASMLAK